MTTPGRGQENLVADGIDLIFIGNMPMMTTVTPTGEMTLDTTSEAGISRGIINNGQMTNKYEFINVAINKYDRHWTQGWDHYPGRETGDLLSASNPSGRHGGCQTIIIHPDYGHYDQNK